MSLTLREFQATRRFDGDLYAAIVDPAAHVLGDAGYVYLDRFGIAEWYTGDEDRDAPSFVLAHGETEAHFPTLEDAERALFARFVRGE